MYDARNPARSRPLSYNVKRLMRLARESPENPDVSQVYREITARELMYCNMQEIYSWQPLKRTSRCMILLRCI